MKPLSLAILLCLAACGSPFTTAAPSSAPGDDAGVDALERPELDAAPDAPPSPAADVAQVGAPETGTGDVLEHQARDADAGDGSEPLDGSLRVDTGALEAGVDASPPDAPAPSCAPSSCPACTTGASPCCLATGCGCYEFGICR
jgi:hypothetical protein